MYLLESLDICEDDDDDDDDDDNLDLNSPIRTLVIKC